MLKQVVFILIFITLKLHGQQIHHVMINSCGASEGANEYFFLQNAGSAFAANAANISLRYGTTTPASGNYTNSFVAAGNTNYVNALNEKLSGGCKFRFKNAPTGTTIMPNKYFMVMYDSPTDTANFSAWCNASGIDSIYVLFSNTPLWNTSGNFANMPTPAPATLRYFRSIINGVTIDYNYTYGWSSNIDGNYAKFPVGGGSAVNYNNAPSCSPSNVVGLPISLLSFNGSLVKNKLSFKAFINSDNYGKNYKIEIANKDLQWQVLEENYTAINESIIYTKYLEYNTDKVFIRFTNLELNESIGPFLLTNSEKINANIYPNPFNTILFIESEEESILTITDLAGRSILSANIIEGTNSINTEQFAQGIYIVKMGDKVFKILK